MKAFTSICAGLLLAINAAAQPPQSNEVMIIDTALFSEVGYITQVRVSNVHRVESVKFRAELVCGGPDPWAAPNSCWGATRDLELLPLETRVWNVQNLFGAQSARCPTGSGFIVISHRGCPSPGCSQPWEYKKAEPWLSAQAYLRRISQPYPNRTRAKQAQGMTHVQYESAVAGHGVFFDTFAHSSFRLISNIGAPENGRRAAVGVANIASRPLQVHQDTDLVIEVELISGVGVTIEESFLCHYYREAQDMPNSFLLDDDLWQDNVVSMESRCTNNACLWSVGDIEPNRETHTSPHYSDGSFF